MLNRSTEAAISAMTYLAEAYDGGKTRLTASEIAIARELQAPFLAKLLTQLSIAGLIMSTPGRGGGYFLARAPGEITLMDIAQCFERKRRRVACPFGSKYCGTGPQCPLHSQVVELTTQIDEFLQHNTLAVCQGYDSSIQG